MNRINGQFIYAWDKISKWNELGAICSTPSCSHMLESIRFGCFIFDFILSFVSSKVDFFFHTFPFIAGLQEKKMLFFTLYLNSSTNGSHSFTLHFVCSLWCYLILLLLYRRIFPLIFFPFILLVIWFGCLFHGSPVSLCFSTLHVKQIHWYGNKTKEEMLKGNRIERLQIWRALRGHCLAAEFILTNSLFAWYRKSYFILPSAEAARQRQRQQ